MPLFVKARSLLRNLFSFRRVDVDLDASPNLGVALNFHVGFRKDVIPPRVALAGPGCFS